MGNEPVNDGDPRVVRPFSDLAVAGGDPEVQPIPFRALVNQSQPIDPRLVRWLCLTLAAFYAFTLLLPLRRWGYIDFLFVRLAVLAYALLGAWLARRLSWTLARLYTGGFALLLPATTNAIAVMNGLEIDAVAPSMLATFVPFVFLLTGRDLLVVASVQIGTTVALCLSATDAAYSPLTFGFLVCGSVTAGAATGLMVMIFRGFMSEDLSWWRAASRRERILREFAEAAGTSRERSHLLATLAARFARTIEGSRCSIVTSKGAVVSDGGPSTPADAPPLPPDAVPSLVQRLATQVRRDTTPVVEWARDPGRRDEDGPGLPHPVRALVALPLPPPAEGAIVLLSPAPIEPGNDALATWQAMANQTGVAVRNADAWEELAAREAETRRLAEERAYVAEMRTRFVMHASHDFRTPLTVILAVTDALLRYDAQLGARGRAERLRRIRETVREMNAMIDDVLAFGRAEAGQVPIAEEATHLTALCAAVLDDVRANASSAHELLLSAQERVTATVDPKLLRRALTNLLANAVKYSPDGGPIVLTAESPDTVELRVSDRGIGIPPEDQAHLFEPFHRGENVGRIRGSGLGLAITAKAIEAMGGTITCESRLGEGSTFIVRLPRTSAEQPG